MNNNYIKAAPIIYIRPMKNSFATSGNTWLTGDYGWRLGNRPDPYVPPTYGIPALVDRNNLNKLMFNNAFGHKWRKTGINGGYFNTDDGIYYTSAGTVSTQAVEFGSGANAYFIDHHTGLGFKWTAQAAKSFSGLVANIQTLTCAGFSDFQLCSVDEWFSLWNFVPTQTNFTFPAYANAFPLSPYNQSIKFCNNGSVNQTGATYYYGGGNLASNRAVGTNDGGIPVRYHFTGQTGI